MKRKTGLVLLTAFLIAKAGLAQVRNDTPKELFLAPFNSGAVSALVKATPDRAVLEKEKIAYLLDRVARSQMIFIRNEEEHSAREAARHLRMKYGFSHGRVQTAKEFIDMIASRSLSSGEIYLIKTEEGISYPARDILYNELNLLEKNIIS